MAVATVEEMKVNVYDKAPGLISEEDIIQKLTSIFVDSIILDSRFAISVASKNILLALGYTNTELAGQCINTLASKNLRHVLEGELAQGFFEEVIFTLNSKAGYPIAFSISGFYLGLISDLNGYIVLKLKNLDEVRQLNRALEDNRAELDKFIYRTAHDLRGPLATMRGLVNLIKLRKDDSEIDLLAGMLEANAEKLDDRLHKLLYLAESGDVLFPCEELSMCRLETSLRKTAERSASMHKPFDLYFTTSEEAIKGLHEQWVISLANNVLLYLVSLPGHEQASIRYHCFCADDGLELKIKSEGFHASKELREVIRQKDSLYSDMLTYPYLINYFAALKVAQKLRAHLRINFVSAGYQEISVFIPFKNAVLAEE